MSTGMDTEDVILLGIVGLIAMTGMGYLSRLRGLGMVDMSGLGECQTCGSAGLGSVATTGMTAFMARVAALQAQSVHPAVANASSSVAATAPATAVVSTTPAVSMTSTVSTAPSVTVSPSGELQVSARDESPEKQSEWLSNAFNRGALQATRVPTKSATEVVVGPPSAAALIHREITGYTPGLREAMTKVERYMRYVAPPTGLPTVTTIDVAPVTLPYGSPREDLDLY